MAYTDIEFLQKYTRRVYSPTTTPTNATVEEYITLAEEEVDFLTGRSWEPTTVTERIYAPSTNLILLKYYPVRSITSVTNKAGNAVSFEQRDRDFIKVQTSSEYIDVTYEYGYDSAPSNIKWLTTLYAVKNIVSSQYSTSNTQSISVGPISISNAVGRSALANIDADIAKYEKRVKRIMR